MAEQDEGRRVEPAWREEIRLAAVELRKVSLEAAEVHRRASEAYVRLVVALTGQAATKEEVN